MVLFRDGAGDTGVTGFILSTVGAEGNKVSGFVRRNAGWQLLLPIWVHEN
jgi:hypothetical protein